MNEQGLTFLGFFSPTGEVDRMIVHQFDAAAASPGGIDTCIRGLASYANERTIAIAGVDTGRGPAGRKIGQWEKYTNGSNEVFFIPVTALDPAILAPRRVPHSIKLSAGLIRFRRHMPQAKVCQTHRADIANVVHLLFRGTKVYFIHTQRNGIASDQSDSFWTAAAAAHRRLETIAIKRAAQVIVFNEEYAHEVRAKNANTTFYPTWFDPKIIRPRAEDADEHGIVWVGRLENPKDPILAIRAFDELARKDSGKPWRLVVVGGGSLAASVQEEVGRLALDVRDRITVAGRLAPSDVGVVLANASVFLMTSHPGYEGYPRVLVEAMAAGLVPVVTEGSDTGGLISHGKTGFVTNRVPRVIAESLASAGSVNIEHVKDAVREHSAPAIVSAIFDTTSK
ncbi:glycosyltransferase [Rhodococcus rhodochrous]|uniref:glycosyltransferase n=1 Tax=Rhodococcus rhodochrous TaxID=1829 RepID=UPI001E2A1A0E|nr:glycosyltransferase [Rhodococcus rhodochrous]MCD2100067.1 glycosyltransferase [Rhodococcus rhodochrous]MCD2124477.1 glycosyltransferase [Rhodococcus rhodochrous]MCQ4137384.1 glycosyltransferase [Rhodococcus rhodochrous]MDJ0021232.1 glycosyltransferase [Rhodococcus rhodochrous]